MTKHAYTYFASGSNHSGEIDGFCVLNAPYGVAVQSINEDGLAAIEENATFDVPVFVDSGAFSEVTPNFPGTKGFDAAMPVGINVTAPISDDEWKRRLAIYKRLAVALGDNLYPVAPDMVGFQAETLERLERYAPEVRELRELGANVIVPLQGSPDGLSLSEMDARVCEILGFDDYVRGIPSNKAPATVESILELLTRAEVKAVHLLGIGPKAGRKFLDRLEAIKAARADVEVLCDAVLITSLAVKGRALFEAHQSFWFNELAPSAFTDETVAYYTDDVAELTDWMGPALRKRFFEELSKAGLATVADKRAILTDPSAWMQEEDDEGYTRWNDWTSQLVDDLFVGTSTAKNSGFVYVETVRLRKRESLVRACASMYDDAGRWVGGFGRA